MNRWLTRLVIHSALPLAAVVAAAAIVNGSSALVGQFAGSHGTVNVDGAGTQWINNGYDLRVGDTGAVGNVATGFLNVTGNDDNFWRSVRQPRVRHVLHGW